MIVELDIWSNPTEDSLFTSNEVSVTGLPLYAAVAEIWLTPKACGWFFHAVRIIPGLILSQKCLCLEGCVESTAFCEITPRQIPNYVCLLVLSDDDRLLPGSQWAPSLSSYECLSNFERTQYFRWQLNCCLTLTLNLNKCFGFQHAGLFYMPSQLYALLYLDTISPMHKRQPLDVKPHAQTWLGVLRGHTAAFTYCWPVALWDAPCRETSETLLLQGVLERLWACRWGSVVGMT